MKYSKQRELIEYTVKNNRIHPTADEVYSILKPNNPSLSLGTVYRNLNTLAESGKIKKLSMADGIHRFDGDVKEHYHVCCEICGNVYDVCELGQEDLTEKGLRELERVVYQQTGVTVTKRNVYLSGICVECAADARIGVGKIDKNNERGHLAK